MTSVNQGPSSSTSSNTSAQMNVVPLSSGTTGATNNGSAEAFGASPSAAGDVNVAAINAALAQGGLVTLTVPGTYTIGKSATVTRASTLAYDLCLVIPSFTTFRLGPAVIIQAAAGLNNVALIQNSNISGGNSKIALEGGTWDGNSANTTRTDFGTTDFACIAMWLQNITGLTLTNITLINPQAWGIGIAACTRVRAANTVFPYTAAVTANQGGYQFQGANTDVIVRDTFGNTYDDLVAFVTDDRNQFNAAMAGAGSANDILIDGVFSDATAGVLHLVRLLDSTSNPLSRVKVRNLSGPYTEAAMIIAPAAGKTSQFNYIVIDGVSCNPYVGTTAKATISIEGAADSISISNWSRQYTNGTETTTKRPCLSISAGTTQHLSINGLTINDLTTAGAGVNFIDVNTSGTIGELETNNVSVSVTLSTGSNNLVRVTATNFIHRWLGSNFSLIKLQSLLNVNSTGGIDRGIFLSNGYAENGQSPLIKTTAVGQLGFLCLTNWSLSATQGGASGCISFTGLSGTCLVQLNNCNFANGANAAIVRSASESIRVQSLSVPIPNAVLTAAVGDIFLDSSNSNNPYRCSVAPSTFVAL